MKYGKIIFWSFYFAASAVALIYFAALRGGWGEGLFGRTLYTIGPFAIMAFPASTMFVVERFFTGIFPCITIGLAFIGVMYPIFRNAVPRNSILAIGLIVIYAVLSYVAFLAIAQFGLFV